MKIQEARKKVLAYYRECWLVWSGTRSPEHAGSMGARMVAAVEIGKRLKIKRGEFVKARK